MIFRPYLEKTRKSNRLQMSLQRQRFLHSYLKIMSVGPAGMQTLDLPLSRPALSQPTELIMWRLFRNWNKVPEMWPVSSVRRALLGKIFSGSKIHRMQFCKFYSIIQGKEVNVFNFFYRWRWTPPRIVLAWFYRSWYHARLHGKYSSDSRTNALFDPTALGWYRCVNIYCTSLYNFNTLEKLFCNPPSNYHLM